MAAIVKLRQLIPKTTAFFICDMQEKFASSIQYFPAIVNVASRILKASKTLEMPVVVTEQYPKGFVSNFLYKLFSYIFSLCNRMSNIIFVNLKLLIKAT